MKLWTDDSGEAVGGRSDASLGTSNSGSASGGAEGAGSSSTTVTGDWNSVGESGSGRRASGMSYPAMSMGVAARGDIDGKDLRLIGELRSGG